MTTAPADLDLVERFLNTLDERTFARHGENHVTTDDLASLEALAAWLDDHGLGAPEAGLRPVDLQTARALRTALRAALTDDEPFPGNGNAPLPAGFALHLVADPAGRLRLSAATGVPGLDVIIETVATHVAANRWNRLRLCASPDCRWAFLDTSRSGAGRWCSMEVCGNRHKTRAYRQRRTSGSTPALIDP